MINEQIHILEKKLFLRARNLLNCTIKCEYSSAGAPIHVLDTQDVVINAGDVGKAGENIIIAHLEDIRGLKVQLPTTQGFHNRYLCVGNGELTIQNPTSHQPHPNGCLLL